MSKTTKQQLAEADIINAFLDMCAESLDPEMMGHVCDAVVDLCDARHIDQGFIRPWAVDAYDCTTLTGPSAMDECPV
jgi:hypothetical protein